MNEDKNIELALKIMLGGSFGTSFFEMKNVRVAWINREVIVTEKCYKKLERITFLIREASAINKEEFNKFINI